MSENSRDSFRWFILVLACLGTFMGTLDISIVTVAMPTLRAVFNTTVATSEWFILSYTFVITILLLTFGKLGDLIGRKRLYECGILIFVGGSLACGLSVSALTLIIARGLQGIGSAMTMSVGPALITAVFPNKERGKAMGFIGSSVALGLITGPVLGGLLLQYASWRWLFFLNIPAGMILFYLFKTRVHGFDERQDTRLDLVGAVLTALTLAPLLLGLTYGGHLGWGSPMTISLFAASVVFGALFFAQEKRAASPMLNLGLFRNREFTIGAVAGWANYAATIPVSVFMPFYLHKVLGFAPDRMGMILAFGPLTLAFVAPISGTLSDKIGPRLLTSLGLLIAAVGVLSMRSLHADSHWFDVAWRLVLTSLGSGMFVSPNSSSVMGSVKQDELGIASGTVALVRNLGMICGIAVAGAIITTISREFSLAGLHAAFTACACIAVLGSVIAAQRVNVKRQAAQA